jgi:Tfp pilus assembly protein PilF
MTMLEAWLKDHADAVDARLSLAMMYQSSKDDVAKAETEYEQVLRTKPDNVIALNNLAIVYAARKDARALGLAQRAYRLARRADIADTLGWIMVGHGDSKDALPYLREAGSALPENMTVQYHLAVGLNASGDKGAARTVLERVIKSKESFGERQDAEKLYRELQSG